MLRFSWHTFCLHSRKHCMPDPVRHHDQLQSLRLFHYLRLQRPHPLSCPRHLLPLIFQPADLFAGLGGHDNLDQAINPRILETHQVAIAFGSTFGTEPLFELGGGLECHGRRETGHVKLGIVAPLGCLGGVDTVQAGINAQRFEVLDIGV